MTDFESKPSNRKNINANGSDPMMELTRLMRDKDSSPNWQNNKQGYDTSINQRQHAGVYVGEELADNETSFGSDRVDPQGYNSVGQENFSKESYWPQGEESTENAPFYQGGQQGNFEQSSGYWSGDPLYPEQQNQTRQENQYAENDSYDYDGAAGSPHEFNPSMEQGASYRNANGSQNPDFANSNQSVVNQQSLDWNGYSDQSQISQQGQRYSDFDQNTNYPDSSFYDDDNYRGQNYSTQNYSGDTGYPPNGDQYPVDYSADQNYDFSQNLTNGEFVSGATQYWASETDENPTYQGEQGDGVQWSPPFDENEQFANEFGVAPNQGIYAEAENVDFSGNGSERGNVLPSQNGGGLPVNHQNDPRGGESAFVGEFPHEESRASASTNPSRQVMADRVIPLPLKENDGDESRPLGAVIAPMRMATQSRSFLGYGQAVSVVPSRNLQKNLSQKSNNGTVNSGLPFSRANPVVPNKEAEKQNAPSNSSPIGRGINPFLVGKTEQKKTEKVAGAATGNKVANVANVNDEFEDALNDFNLTIKGDSKKRYKRDTGLKTVRPDQHAVPETQNFDLPPVYYGEGGNGAQARNPFDQEFLDVLAPGVQHGAPTVHNQVEGDENEDRFGGGLDGLAQGSQQSIQPAFADGAGDASKYDWASSHNDNSAPMNKSGSGKKILLLLGGLAIVLACVGCYYAFFSDKDTSSEPVVIQRDEGYVKVAPPVDASANQTNQDQGVYNRVESVGAPKTEQSELIDHSEAPMDLDKVDEQAPNANETSLELNSVESRVLEATQNSLAIHEVPTVTIRDNNNVSGDDINAIIASQQENVLTPGQSFRDHLQPQTNGQQALPNDSLPAGSAIASNINGYGSGQFNGQNGAIASNSAQSQADAQTNIALETQQSNNNGLASLSTNDPVETGGLFGTSPVVGNNDAPTNVAPQPANPIHMPPAAEDNSSVQNQVGAGLPAGTFYVQVASQPSRDAAQKSLADIKRQPQIRSLIGNHQVVIVGAEIPGRGTYYRVRIAANSQANANQLCNQLKDLQVTCFVGK